MANKQARQAALIAAKRLLDPPPSAHEDYVRQNLVRLLDALGIENDLTYWTDEGPADIYLPRRKVMIETKAPGLATEPDAPQHRENNETPREQVERYLMSELESEREMLPFDEIHDKPWTGVLTDGVVWHAWKYDAETGERLQSPLSSFHPHTPDQLLERIKPIIGSEIVGKPWIPADPRPLFEPSRRKLQSIYENLSGTYATQTETKLQLWLELLRTSNMEPENESAKHRLFVTHSFLVALARGVIHTLARPEEKLDTDVLLGDGFIAWISATTGGRQWARKLLDEIHGYEWRRRRGDVLRPLYERFVDAKDRQDFGEYYTPDWLAEMLVGEVLDEAWCERAIDAALAATHDPNILNGTGMLDPTCGSGTFLYHAARRILNSGAMKRQGLSPVHQADVVSTLVNGIDVHPVAAEIARATVLRALPAGPSEGSAAIRVYEGDALLIRTHDEDSLFTPKEDELRFETPSGGEVFLPRSFVNLPEFAESLRRVVVAATNRNAIPADIRGSVPEEDRTALAKARDSLEAIIQREGNSVWTWYITNTTGPYRLKERKIDRIVANPPWVSMAGIQAETRKRVLESFARDKAKLWSGGRNAPHFDIAQLFVKRCRELYMANPRNNPAAWLVKRSALTAGSWSKFREWHADTLAQSIDLVSVQPFGGGDARRCCVLFDHRRSAGLTDDDSNQLLAQMIGNRPSPDMACQEAMQMMSFVPAPSPLPEQRSGYVDYRGEPLFRQGATITPKVLTITDTIKRVPRSTVRRATTARSNKKPWSEVAVLTDDFPAEWFHSLLTSNDLFPFALAEQLPEAIIPTDKDGSSLLTDPVSESRAWRRFDDIYREHRGLGRSTPKTLINQIDYGKKLSSQLPLTGTDSTLVLHPTSGDIMRAARAIPADAVIGHTLHSWRAPSEAAAAYLVGLLNAPTLNTAFVKSRTSGRHFTNNPWRKVPIPKFDLNNTYHQELAQLTEQAEILATDWLSENPTPRGQVAVSKRIRALLADAEIFYRIDEIAREILPLHAINAS